jgi:hypothetical protein
MQACLPLLERSRGSRKVLRQVHPGRGATWLARVVGETSCPQELGSQVQRVPKTAASSKTLPSERTWLVQAVSEPLLPREQAYAQEVPVEKSDLERAVPEAAQVKADPPSIAAHGCGGREEPADSEAGQASRAARQAEEGPGVQPGEGEPRRACGGEEEAHDIRDVGRRARGGGVAEEEPEVWLWCRRRQASRNTTGNMCRTAGDACNIRDPGDCAVSRSSRDSGTITDRLGRTCSEGGDAFDIRDVGRCVGGCGDARGELAASGQRAALQP